MSFQSLFFKGRMRMVESMCKWLIMNILSNKNKSYLSVC